MSARVSYGEAARILAARDPVLARLVEEAGPMRIRRRTMSPFEALVYQQLAGPAARAIHGRLVAALDDRVEPEALLALSDETLRSVGLSSAKARSLRDLASRTLDGTVILSPRALARQSDDEVVARLSSVRGIGPWTAQMFLIFRLRRLDVWSVGDLGVRHGYGLAWNVPTPSARELARRALSAVPDRADLVLLAGRRAPRRRRGERGHDLITRAALGRAYQREPTGRGRKRTCPAALQSHRRPLRQEQERHGLSNEGRASQAQPSDTFILSSRTRQPAAQPHGSGIRSADPGDRHGARE